MPRIDVQVTCPIHDSFRVRQIAGLFDVPIEARASERFQLDLPDLDDPLSGIPASSTAAPGCGESCSTVALGCGTAAAQPGAAVPPGAQPWRIGLVVGPSGSGKTTIAQRLFGDRFYRRQGWPQDRAVIDGFGDRPIRQIAGLLTAVGFSSPPSWIKPYQALSTGEQFRCDLARALAAGQPDNSPNPSRPGMPVAFDEFTSVVDRNAARVASAAIAKAIHQGMITCRFVAVTCHYDVIPWIQPDWVLDMATRQFNWRHLPRPRIDLEIFRCRRGAWQAFARHHYLSGSLSRAARSFLAVWQGAPVAFCATVSLIGYKNRWRISRIVTLPDYQGIGIGTAVMETVARLHRSQGHRVNLTASHPAVIAHCRRSPLWRAVKVKRTGSSSATHFIANYQGSAGRAVVSFEFQDD